MHVQLRDTSGKEWWQGRNHAWGLQILVRPPGCNSSYNNTWLLSKLMAKLC